MNEPNPDDRVVAFFARCPNAQKVMVVSSSVNVMVVQWSRTGVGFGEVTLTWDDAGLHVDSEAMNPDFVKELLSALIDEAKRNGRFT